ncbi:MAG: cobyrinate a,c-diamide synthase [Desulfobacterales bacterium]|nr:cobyrinate a,c-diamide synthase [Desulfobacterales bacterium]
MPRLLVSALRGGSGKTILSVGIIAAWVDSGRRVIPFKKGPDYIDAGWLALAAGRPCFNLDTFLIAPQTIRRAFLRRAPAGDVSVIEGNRGLYDGIDLEGSTSTAELAKLIEAPVVLALDATKTTRTLAAVVGGCRQFDPLVFIGGVILNRVAGARHEAILTKSIEHHCGLPVVGAVPKLDAEDFPERHMGLVPTAEHGWARDSVAAPAEVARAYLDLEALWAMAEKSPPLTDQMTDADRPALQDGRPATVPVKPVIGVIRDSAFQFYYPENIEALEQAGAGVVFFSPLETADLPEIDGLYIGGGFPETHAAALAGNGRFRRQLRERIEEGLPVYAECGGLMYLGEKLVLAEGAFPMTGALPVVYGFSRKPQGHGYTIFSVDGKNPFYPVGTRLRGHEFHYSKVVEFKGADADLVFSMERGKGLIGGRDGLVYRNVLATYSHIHAAGTPQWAPALVDRAREFQRRLK